KPLWGFHFSFRLTRSESSSQRRIDPSFAGRHPRIAFAIRFSHRVALGRRPSLLVGSRQSYRGVDCRALLLNQSSDRAAVSYFLSRPSVVSNFRVAHFTAFFVVVNPLSQDFLGLVSAVVSGAGV